jgi:long-subunit acyl-CoA synthetase (AMP-forming)
VNVPGASRLGSVGRPLPHVQLKFAPDGEIRVAGSVFSGYLGAASVGTADDYWATGDTGYLDADGFLFVTGRKRNVFITSFGRNVAPEWVESQLLLDPRIAQAAVFGEARPFNVAVVVARDHGLPAEVDGIARAIAVANANLPDYARVGRWILADAPFSVAHGQYTGSGRPRRAAIWSTYAARIKEIYDTATHSEAVA